MPANASNQHGSWHSEVLTVLPAVSYRARGMRTPSLKLMSTYVAVFALILAYVALVAAYCALRTLAKLRRATALLSRGTRTGSGKQSLIEATTRQAELTATVAAELEQLRAHVDRSHAQTVASVEAAGQATFEASTKAAAHVAAEQAAALAAERAAALAARLEAEQAAEDEATSGALRNVALVRYDAFAGTSGRMSFSLALLDEDGNGVTISALAGQTDTRVYAKGIAHGKGENELSPEELQAVSSAVGRRRPRPRIRKAS
ncbi:MAG: DUF4446 family protein [Jatrophihabitantaceae bacterium]